MSTKDRRIRIKSVGKTEMNLRATKKLFTSLRYMLGNMNTNDFAKFCRDKEMGGDIEALWFKLLNEDFRDIK